MGGWHCSRTRLIPVVGGSNVSSPTPKMPTHNNNNVVRWRTRSSQISTSHNFHSFSIFFTDLFLTAITVQIKLLLTIVTTVITYHITVIYIYIYIYIISLIVYFDNITHTCQKKWQLCYQQSFYQLGPMFHYY